MPMSLNRGSPQTRVRLLYLLSEALQFVNVKSDKGRSKSQQQLIYFSVLRVTTFEKSFMLINDMYLLNNNSRLMAILSHFDLRHARIYWIVYTNRKRFLLPTSLIFCFKE